MATGGPGILGSPPTAGEAMAAVPQPSRPATLFERVSNLEGKVHGEVDEHIQTLRRAVSELENRLIVVEREAGVRD